MKVIIYIYKLLEKESVNSIDGKEFHHVAA